MDFLNKMERKFGRYAIPNLIIYLIGAYCIGFFLQYLSPTLLGYLNMQHTMYCTDRSGGSSPGSSSRRTAMCFS